MLRRALILLAVAGGLWAGGIWVGTAFSNRVEPLEAPVIAGSEASSAAVASTAEESEAESPESPKPEPVAPRKVDWTVEGIDLVGVFRGSDGTEQAHRADRAINPASAVKMATTLWALEQLGQDARFETIFEIREADGEFGAAELIVHGGGDPDFHIENAQQVARALAEHGVGEVRTLTVGPGFWIGWEGGSERRKKDPRERGLQMARRLQKAWDPSQWSAATRKDMDAAQARNAASYKFTAIQVNELRYDPDLEVRPPVSDSRRSAGTQGPALLHTSGRLAAILKRFNDYSNNDIERLGIHLGSAAEMQAYYRTRWPDSGVEVRFSSLSGLGVNRVSPRWMVRLLDGIAEFGEKSGSGPESIFPGLHCGRSTLRNFPELLKALPQGSLVGKTGTLVQTDGGVGVLAGWVGKNGETGTFFVAAPKNGARLRQARRAQSRWLLEVLGPNLPQSEACGTSEIHSDSDSRVQLLS